MTLPAAVRVGLGGESAVDEDVVAHRGRAAGDRDRQETTAGGRIGYELFPIAGLRYPDAGKVATADIFRTFD